MVDMSNGFGLFSDEPEETKPEVAAVAAQVEEDEEHEEPDESLFLTFNLGSETYAAELLTVREIIEFQKPKPLPNTLDFFEGVINLRGEIVGIIDLRKKFGLEAKPLVEEEIDDDSDEFESRKHIPLLIFDSSSGALGAMVDRVGKVCNIEKNQIDHSPNIKTRVPTQYLQGIGVMGDELITIVNLKKVLDEGELLKVENIQKAV